MWLFLSGCYNQLVGCTCSITLIWFWILLMYCNLIEMIILARMLHLYKKHNHLVCYKYSIYWFWFSTLKLCYNLTEMIVLTWLLQEHHQLVCSNIRLLCFGSEPCWCIVMEFNWLFLLHYCNCFFVATDI